jgi:hypothetical protein
MHKFNTSFRLDRSLIDQARKLAQRDHMTLTQFVTAAILKAVRKRRTFMACLCLGLLLAGCVSQADQQARQRWYDSLTPEQQVRLEERRLQALGMFLGSGGFRSFQPQPLWQPPAAQVPRQLNCYSNTFGTQTSTTCY